jgi:hypothetical protein
MPTTAERKNTEAVDAAKAAAFVERIKFNYLAKVGRPSNYQKLNCRQVNGNHWRLTMWVREGDYGSTIGPTHFVTVDEEGSVLELR